MSGQGKSEAYLSNGAANPGGAAAKQDRETLRRGVEPHENVEKCYGIAYIRNGIGAMCKAKLWRGPVKHGGGIAQIGMAVATDRIDVSCDAMA